MTGCGWPAVWRDSALSPFSSRFVLSGVALCVCVSCWKLNVRGDDGVGVFITVTLFILHVTIFALP
jgi:hypothetical protein